MRQIYLDYNATTPVAPSVVQAMLPYFTEHFGNASSSHVYGRAASEAIRDARSKVATFLGCRPDEIIFTGGGTESNNLALQGALLSQGLNSGAHLVVSEIEHPAIKQPALFLERLGFEVTFVGCDEQGVVHPETVESALRPNTCLVSVMHSNNEDGAIQPIRQIAEICRDRNILMHTDASQSAGKIPTRVDLMDVDMLTLAGHKFYGPKGIGVLYVRGGVQLEPVIHGADHERGFRAGTENTAYIVGIGQAAGLATQAINETSDQMTRLRDRLADQLEKVIGPELIVHAQKTLRLPNTLSVSFPGVAGHDLLARVPEICASTGAACHSEGEHCSSTLQAMGVSPQQAAGTIRLSIGWNTSTEQIDKASSMLLDAWEKMTAAV